MKKLIFNRLFIIYSHTRKHSLSNMQDCRTFSLKAFFAFILFINNVFAFQPTPITPNQWFQAPGLKIDSLQGFATARGVNTEPGTGNILVLARDAGKVVCLIPNASLDIQDTGRVDLLNLTQPELPEFMFSHGLAVDPSLKWLYVSTGTTIWRFAYEAGCKAPLSNQVGEQVIVGIPTVGHFTRTLTFDPAGKYLYIGVGSKDNNADGGPNRSLIIRYPVGTLNVQSTYPAGGEVVGTGLRNSVGMRFDPKNANSLWQVENGADDLYSPDYPENAVEYNPAEELNVIDITQPSKWYGFPQCFSEWNMENITRGRGSAWPWPKVPSATMEYCNSSSNVRPVHVFQSHMAPLDVAWISQLGNNPDSLPNEWLDNVFVTFKGSWNPRIPRGYKVMRVPRDPKTGLPGAIHYDVFGQKDPEINCPNSPADAKNKCIRPVGLAMDKYNRLWVSIETLGQVVRISRDPTSTVSVADMNLNPENGAVVGSPVGPPDPPIPTPTPSSASILKPILVMIALLFV
jgi:glucose/arabinose dehydrogenase